SALEEARVRLNSSLAEAEAIKADADKALVEAGDETESASRSEAERALLSAAREKLEQARLKLGNFENAARMRTARLGQITAEAQNWQRRRDGAAAQIETLSARATEIAEQLKAASAAPDSFGERRAKLDSEIAAAQTAHRAATDRL